MKTIIKIIADVTIETDTDIALDDLVSVTVTGQVTSVNLRRPFTSKPRHQSDPVRYIEISEDSKATLERLGGSS